MKNLEKTLLKILAIWIIVFCFYTPVSAQLNDYTVLAPIPGTYNTDGTTNFKTYLPGMFKLIISIGAVLAFVMITYGGFLYATSDAISGKESGRGYVTNAIYGLIFVIGAWVLLNTINPKILSFDLTFQSPTLGAVGTTTVVSGGAATQLQPATIAAYNDLLVQCNCSLVQTSTVGGTHSVGSAHYLGLAIDIAPSTDLNKYLTGSTNQPADCFRVTKTLAGKTSNFLWEKKGSTCGGTEPSSGDHWHMSVIP